MPPQRVKRSTLSVSWTLFAPDSKQENLFILPHEVDTIYAYSRAGQTLEPHYRLDFHGGFLTADKHPSGPREDAEMSDIIRNRKYVYSIYSFCQASGRLFFKLAGKQDDCCMIDLQTDALYAFDRLFDGFRPKAFNPFIGSDGRCLYLIVREKDLGEHYRGRTSAYPAIRQLLPTLDVRRNGWILLAVQIKR